MSARSTDLRSLRQRGRDLRSRVELRRQHVRGAAPRRGVVLAGQAMPPRRLCGRRGRELLRGDSPRVLLVVGPEGPELVQRSRADDRVPSWGRAPSHGDQRLLVRWASRSWLLPSAATVSWVSSSGWAGFSFTTERLCMAATSGAAKVSQTSRGTNGSVTSGTRARRRAPAADRSRTGAWPSFVTTAVSSVVAIAKMRGGDRTREISVSVGSGRSAPARCASDGDRRAARARSRCRSPRDSRAAPTRARPAARR